MNGKAQLNGLVVLYAYLQRIFVYDKVIAGFSVTPPSGSGPVSSSGWAGCLDEVGSIIGAFDRDTGLAETQLSRLLEILGEVRAAMRARRPDPDAPLPERLAAVAGDLYGGMHTNDGIVHWGGTFDPAVADRYRQRTLGHRAAVNTISGFVARATAGNALGADDLARLDAWFTGVCAGTAAVERDLDDAAELLQGRTPG